MGGEPNHSVKRSTNGNEATGRPPCRGNELPKQDPTPAKSAADQHVFDVSVPNYNAQGPRRVQNKKRWWRWDFALRWRKGIFPVILRMLRMSTQIPNMNVAWCAWRRVKKGSIKVCDLKPVTDVKGGGVKSESKPSAGGTGSTGSR